MRASHPKSVFPLSERLPSYGENRVNIRSEGADLFVDIFYDGPGSSAEKMVTLSFLHVCSVYFSAAPGVNLLTIEYDRSGSLRDLVEYEHSEAANSWSAHFSDSRNRIRHFQVYFLTANKRLEVFAEGYSYND